LCSLAALHAQASRGTISGKVFDPAGDPVLKTQIIATETRTGTKSSAVSDESGGYIIPFLAQGTYEISAEAQGFKKYVQQDIALSAGEKPSVDPYLTIGNVTASVTISSGLPPLAVTNATVGQIITTAEVEDLPINGRTPMMLDNQALGAISNKRRAGRRPARLEPRLPTGPTRHAELRGWRRRVRNETRKLGHRRPSGERHGAVSPATAKPTVSAACSTPSAAPHANRAHPQTERGNCT
jgi:hypothetical protein